MGSARAGSAPPGTSSATATADTVTTVGTMRLFAPRRAGGAKGRFGKGNPTGASIEKGTLATRRDMGKPGQE
ncbi:hypothetical protein Sru01_13620 [Sphaerisporangium rufum]|uniref:Uncharacterized protein n=1 Tax=Sphaerisporangium rufum TaxID=1381558 RepID=A0A919V3K4_9ACTN|nr:hypothetical protein Sru01_13620 [Sphaerisporangium rufum]